MNEEDYYGSLTVYSALTFFGIVFLRGLILGILAYFFIAPEYSIIFSLLFGVSISLLYLFIQPMGTNTIVKGE